MWSHLSPYKDQRDNKNSGQGKQLCDLLAVFGDDLFVFEDKACEWPTKGELSLRWSRWRRRTISEAAGQIAGAERWLREHPHRVFADAACSRRLPVEIPSPSRHRIHRIIVASGAANACREHFGGGSGSLTIHTHPALNESPFSVGIEGAKGAFVHVLDEATLDLVIGELDTMPEFRDYLLAKEKLIARGQHISAPGEEDLLAYYLGHGDADQPNHHGFGRTDGYEIVSFPEGGWEDFERSLRKRARDQANQHSYAWDKLIDRFAQHSIEGTQYYSTHHDPHITERILRLMNAEPRAIRRAFVDLAYKNLSALGDRPHKYWGTLSPAGSRTCYTFIVLRQYDNENDDDYRNRRLAFIELCTAITRLEYPNAGGYVGIAMSPLDVKSGSEDLVLLEDAAWTAELQDTARRTQRELGLLADLKQVRIRESEFPSPRIPFGRPAGSDRNEPCPCGSGRKWKRCCGG